MPEITDTRQLTQVTAVYRKARSLKVHKYDIATGRFAELVDGIRELTAPAGTDEETTEVDWRAVSADDEYKVTVDVLVTDIPRIRELREKVEHP